MPQAVSSVQRVKCIQVFLLRSSQGRESVGEKENSLTLLFSKLKNNNYQGTKKDPQCFLLYVHIDTSSMLTMLHDLCIFSVNKVCILHHLK